MKKEKRGSARPGSFSPAGVNAMLPLAAALALVSGCASLDSGYYAPPQGKPVAKLHIDYVASAGAPVVHVRVLEKPLGRNCLASPSDPLLSALGGVPSPGYTPAMSRDVVIAAGEPINLQAGTGTHAFGPSPNVITVTSCVLRTRFTPDPGAQYEMVYMREQGRCRLSLRMQTTGTDGKSAALDVPFVDPHPECSRK